MVLITIRFGLRHTHRSRERPHSARFEPSPPREVTTGEMTAIGLRKGSITWHRFNFPTDGVSLTPKRIQRVVNSIPRPAVSPGKPVIPVHSGRSRTCSRPPKRLPGEWRFSLGNCIASGSIRMVTTGRERPEPAILGQWTALKAPIRVRIGVICMESAIPDRFWDFGAYTRIRTL